MSNGLSRVEKYRGLTVEEHLRQLDNDLDTADYNRQIIVDSINAEADKRFEKLNRLGWWTLTTFVSLILLVCGTLLAVVIR